MAVGKDSDKECNKLSIGKSQEDTCRYCELSPIDVKHAILEFDR